MGHFMPALNGSCSCPPMGPDLGPNPARYIGPCRPGTKIFRAVPCLGRAFFTVLRAGPSGPAQMYTYKCIKHEFSTPYTPQQNGVVERKNRTLLDMARTMLDEYKTPDRFWAEAINIACYSINRLYLHRILKKTSYELLTGKSQMFYILEPLGVNALFLLKEVENLNLLVRL